MGIITSKQLKLTDSEFNINLERYFSSSEVVHDCTTRCRTDLQFKDFATHQCKKDWEGVSSYQEALDLLKFGYQPVIDKLKKAERVKKAVYMQRVFIRNNVIGCAPVVPLALKNVPYSMLDVTMKPIRRKVVDIYYDMTTHCGVDPKDIVKAGSSMLSTIMDLERQGYRFNLYGVQSYCDRRSADVLCVKIKSSDKPLDLSRMSFPLTHPGFFRVIGFDWYSKFPKGKYRDGYGKALQYVLNVDSIKEFAQSVFGDNAVYVSCTSILDAGEDHIKEMLVDEPITCSSKD